MSVFLFLSFSLLLATYRPADRPATTTTTGETSSGGVRAPHTGRRPDGTPPCQTGRAGLAGPPLHHHWTTTRYSSGARGIISGRAKTLASQLTNRQTDSAIVSLFWRRRRRRSCKTQPARIHHTARRRRRRRRPVAEDELWAANNPAAAEGGQTKSSFIPFFTRQRTNEQAKERTSEQTDEQSARRTGGSQEREQIVINHWRSGACWLDLCCRAL